MIKVKPPPFFDYEDTHGDSHHQSGEWFSRVSIIQQATKSSIFFAGSGNSERNGEESDDVIGGAEFTPVALSLIHFVCLDSHFHV